MENIILSKEFVNSYADKKAPWGFNGLGEIVYRRTYSRDIESLGRKEYWHETIERCINGAQAIGANYTKEEAERLLLDDLKTANAAAAAVTGLSSGPVFWAVTSFVFNLGPGALHGKTTQIARHLVMKNYPKAAAGMQRYVYGGGRKLPGLVKRRKEEGEMLVS